MNDFAIVHSFLGFMGVCGPFRLTGQIEVSIAVFPLLSGYPRKNQRHPVGMFPSSATCGPVWTKRRAGRWDTASVPDAFSQVVSASGRHSGGISQGEYLKQLQELKDREILLHPDIMGLNQQIVSLSEQNHTLHGLWVKKCIDFAFLSPRPMNWNKKS